MLAIGRALMMQPKILILDEPTLGLAPVILELLSKALEKLRQTTPITVLLGEQNVTFALPHADRVYVLEHARIVWEGDPAVSPPKPAKAICEKFLKTWVVPKPVRVNRLGRSGFPYPAARVASDRNPGVR